MTEQPPQGPSYPGDDHSYGSGDGQQPPAYGAPQQPQQPQQPPAGSYPPPGYPPQGYQGQPYQAQPYNYAYPAYQYTPPAPKHPSAVTAMVLGIITLAGGVMCYLPLLLGPFAWWLGSKSVNEIDASGGQLGGRGEANTGKILGIIGTVLLILALLALTLFIVLAVTADSSYDY